MKPEYQFTVESLTSKEQVVDGLLKSGYILSVKERVGRWEVSVYGKERVDGNGHKPSEWFEKHTTPVIVTTPHWDTNTIWCNTVTTPTTLTSTVNTKESAVPPKPLVGFESRTVLE